jgi:hypothetical protein
MVRLFAKILSKDILMPDTAIVGLYVLDAVGSAITHNILDNGFGLDVSN